MEDERARARETGALDGAAGGRDRARRRGAPARAHPSLDALLPARHPRRGARGVRQHGRPARLRRDRGAVPRARRAGARQARARARAGGALAPAAARRARPGCRPGRRRRPSARPTACPRDPRGPARRRRAAARPSRRRRRRRPTARSAARRRRRTPIRSAGQLWSTTPSRESLQLQADVAGVVAGRHAGDLLEAELLGVEARRALDVGHVEDRERARPGQAVMTSGRPAVMTIVCSTCAAARAVVGRDRPAVVEPTWTSPVPAR